VSFAIANNLLAPSTKATDLGTSLQAIVVGAWNNFENLEDGSFGMKHHDKMLIYHPRKPTQRKMGNNG
jgi:hypothetical protein